MTLVNHQDQDQDHQDRSTPDLDHARRSSLWGRRDLLKWGPGALAAGGAWPLAGAIAAGPEPAPAPPDPPESGLRVNAADFGTIGDGTTDNAAAIVRAMDRLTAQGGGIVEIPAGTYALASPLPLPDQIHVRGQGPGATVLKSLGNFPVFREIRDGQTPMRAAVSDMIIVGGGKSNPDAHGIVTRFSNRSRFENLSFRSCRHALDIAHAWQLFCINLSVEGAGADQNHVGWWMHETDLQYIDNAVQAVNCNVQGVEKYGFRLVNFQGSKFVNCEACGVMEHGWYLGDPASGDTKVCWGVFANCLADSTRSDGWRIVRGQATDLKEIQLANCWAGNTGGHGVRIEGGEGLVLSNWLIIEPFQCGLQLEHCSRTTFSSGSIREFNRTGEGYAGINLVHSSHNIIAHNHCHSSHRDSGGGRGVDENGDSDANLVIGNQLSGFLQRGGRSRFDQNVSTDPEPPPPPAAGS